MYLSIEYRDEVVCIKMYFEYKVQLQIHYKNRKAKYLSTKYRAEVLKGNVTALEYLNLSTYTQIEGDCTLHLSY